RLSGRSLKPEQFGIDVLRAQGLWLGEQCLQGAIAAALVEYFVPQEGRQADEVPTPKPDVETLVAVRAPNQAFAIENKEDFLGLMAVHRDAVTRRHRLDRHCERGRRDRAA